MQSQNLHSIFKSKMTHNTIGMKYIPPCTSFWQVNLLQKGKGKSLRWFYNLSRISVWWLKVNIKHWSWTCMHVLRSYSMIWSLDLWEKHSQGIYLSWSKGIEVKHSIYGNISSCLTWMTVTWQFRRYKWLAARTLLLSA